MSAIIESVAVRRKVTNVIALSLCGASAFAAAGVLLLILSFVIIKGAAYINWDLFTELPKPFGESGGGVSNSIVGSTIIVGLAAVIGIPAGIAIGVFVTEYAGPAAATAVRFAADVLTGVPSIIVGVFLYSVFVVRMGSFSALAGSLALAMIMLPIVARSSEEMLKLVPQSQREAALALGITRWRTIISVVIPAAQRGLVTGALLAIARATGETAPLMFTVLGNQFMSHSVTGGPIDALPLRIFQYATDPYVQHHEQAWAASFTLLLFVFVINLVSRFVLTRGTGRGR